MDNFLDYSSVFLLVIIVFLYLFKYNHNKKSKVYRLICIYLVYIMIIQLSSGMMSYHRIHNLHLSHFYFFGEFLILSLFFRELLINRQKKKANVLIIFAICLLATLFIMSGLGIYDLNPFDPFEIIICALPIIILSITHLYNSLTNSLKFLYLTIGIIIYKTISAVAFILLNFANAVDYFDDFSALLWRLNAVFVLVYYALLFFEWYKSFKHKRVS